jgi:hypothetical protein
VVSETAQVVNRRFPTAATMVRAHVMSRSVCGEQTNKREVSASFSVSLSIHFTECITLIIIIIFFIHHPSSVAGKTGQRV